ncbi:MAG: SGNH/GDSL hydrolase family protein [Eubacteriales bacterium]
MNTIFKDGDTVLFQGDSITDCFQSESLEESMGNGYASMVSQIYQILYPKVQVKFVNKGVSGNATKNLLERYEKDFKEIQPDFISILVGINDLRREGNYHIEPSYETFMNQYRKLLDQIKRDLPNAKIMILEPFMLDTDPKRDDFRKDLDSKIAGVRILAREYADYYLPLDGILAKLAYTKYLPFEISEDGVHPTAFGHSLIAYEYMKTLNII